MATTVAVRDFRDDRYLVFATEQGTVKKTELAGVRQPAWRRHHRDQHRARATACSTSASPTASAGHPARHRARASPIRFPEADVRPMGRATYGVRGISAAQSGDQVVGMEALESDGDILTVAERGYGKRTSIDEYREQGRGGKGIINLKVIEQDRRGGGRARGGARRPASS